MELDPEDINGQTQLDEDEKEDLLIKSISTRDELNEYEQQNIEKAVIWSLKRNFQTDDILTESFVKDLHKRMYGEVWKWAGQFRKTNKNLGIDKHQIDVQLNSLLDDARHWMQNNVFFDDEIALRFKHRLLSIHCFPNGNGRHSRLMADIIISYIFKKPVFTWGAAQLEKQKEVRKKYLQAIKEADRGNYGPLIAFARS